MAVCKVLRWLATVSTSRRRSLFGQPETWFSETTTLYGLNPNSHVFRAMRILRGLGMRIL